MKLDDFQPGKRRVQESTELDVGRDCAKLKRFSTDQSLRWRRRWWRSVESIPRRSWWKFLRLQQWWRVLGSSLTCTVAQYIRRSRTARLLQDCDQYLALRAENCCRRAKYWSQSWSNLDAVTVLPKRKLLDKLFCHALALALPSGRLLCDVLCVSSPSL